MPKIPQLVSRPAGIVAHVTSSGAGCGSRQIGRLSLTTTLSLRLHLLQLLPVSLPLPSRLVKHPKHTSTQQNSECSKCFHTCELISIENRLSQGIRGQQQLFCPGALMHLRTQGQMGTYTPRCVLAGDSEREVAGRK